MDHSTSGLLILYVLGSSLRYCFDLNAGIMAGLLAATILLVGAVQVSADSMAAKVNLMFSHGCSMHPLLPSQSHELPRRAI